jgi:hypothetical protein
VIEDILTVLGVLVMGGVLSMTTPMSRACRTCGIPAGALLGLVIRTGPRCPDCGLR